jgi:hypothetical protein
LSLLASTLSFHGPFEPLKLLNLDFLVFIADPDSAFHADADADPAPKNNADPDQQPWIIAISFYILYPFRFSHSFATKKLKMLCVLSSSGRFFSVYETGAQGLVVAAMLERLGGV